MIKIAGNPVEPGTLDPWSLSGSLYQDKASDIFIVAANDTAITATTLELHFDNSVLEYGGELSLTGRANVMSVVSSALGNPSYGARMVIYSLDEKTIEIGYGNIAKVSLQPVEGVAAGTKTKVYLTHKSAVDTLASAEFTVLSSNGQPFLYDPGPQEIRVGEQFLLELYGEDMDGDPVSYGVEPFGHDGEYLMMPTTGQFLWTPTQAGNYTVTFTITDGENETSQAVEFTVIAGNVAPEWADESLILQAAEGETLSHTFTAPTDFNNDPITVTANNLPDGAQFDAGTLILTWTPAFDDQGEFEFTLTATDPDNEQANLYVTIMVANANQPPQITVPQDSYQIDAFSGLTFFADASDPDGQNLTYSATGMPPGATFNGGQFSCQYIEEGEFALELIVTDPDGAADTARVTILAVLKNYRPVMIPPPDVTVEAGEQMNIVLNAIDPNNDPLTYTLITTAILDRGAAFSGETFTWTPAASDIGINIVKFKVEDPEGLSDSCTVKITVSVDGRTTPIPVAFADFDSLVVEEGEELTYRLPLATEGHEYTIFWAENLPEGAEFQELIGELTWTPGYQQQGIYSISVGVNDGSFTDTRNLKITVKDKNLPPVLASITNLTVAEGDQLDYTFTASDPGGDWVTFSATGLPSGANLNSSGHLSYSPGFEAAGSYPITVVASDGAGNTDEESLLLVVENTNRNPILCPTVVSPTHRYGSRPGRLLRVLINATDPDKNDIVTITHGELPGTATYNPGDFIFTWLPENADNNKTWEVWFYASDDNGGLDSQNVYFSIGDVTEPPTFTSHPPTEIRIVEGQPSTFEWTAFDPDSIDLIRPISFSADRNKITYTEFPYRDKNDRSLLENPMSLAVTILADYANTKSSVNFKIHAVDDVPAVTGYVGRVSLSHLIYITAVNPSPVFTSLLAGSEPLAVTIDENATLSLDLTAQDPDGTRPAFTITPSLPNSYLAFNAPPNPDQWVFTPSYSQSGYHQIALICTDGEFIVQKQVNITVNDVNRPPSVPPLEDQSVNEGDFITFLVDAIDPDGDAFQVFTAGDVPFLTAGTDPPARIRDGNVFIFDTALLPQDQQIESAYFRFWAEDTRGGVSDTVQVEIAVVRQESTDVDLGGTLLAAVQTITWEGMGLSIDLNNSTGGQLTGNISAYEKSGFINPSAGYDLPLLAEAGKIKKPTPGLYTFLAGELTSQFYSLRRGWGINMQAFANSGNPDSLTNGLGATVTVTYLQADIPDEIPNFTESRMRVFGFDSELNTWVLAEGQSVDTLANTATFALTDPSITEYTLGASIDVIPPQVSSVQLKAGTFTISPSLVDTVYSLAGDYQFTVKIDDDEVLSSSKTSAMLYYALGSEAFSSTGLTRTSSTAKTFTATLALGAQESGATLNYYIVAGDEMNEVSLPADAPQSFYQVSLLEYTGQPGDLDQNTVINIFDVLELLKVIGGTSEPSLGSDVDQNGKTDIFDLLELLKLL